MVAGAASESPRIAHLALRHELTHRADCLFDRRVGVDPVLVVQVDVVDAEAAERGLAGLTDVLGPAVDAAVGRVVGVAHDAELGGDDGHVASARQRLAHEDLVREGPVHVGRVEEGHAELEGAVDRGDGLVVVRLPVEVRHPHAAQPLARHDQALRSERNRLHGAPLRRAGRPRWLDAHPMGGRQGPDRMCSGVETGGRRPDSSSAWPFEIRPSLELLCHTNRFGPA